MIFHIVVGIAHWRIRLRWPAFAFLTAAVHRCLATLASSLRRCECGRLCDSLCRLFVSALCFASSGVHQARGRCAHPVRHGVELAIAVSRRARSWLAAASIALGMVRLEKSGTSPCKALWKASQLALCHALRALVGGGAQLYEGARREVVGPVVFSQEAGCHHVGAGPLGKDQVDDGRGGSIPGVMGVFAQGAHQLEALASEGVCDDLPNHGVVLNQRAMPVHFCAIPQLVVTVEVTYEDCIRWGFD